MANEGLDKELDALIEQWNSGAGTAFLQTYAEQCAFVSKVYDLTARTGRAGQFRHVVEDMFQPKLPYETAHYMVRWHHIHTLKDKTDPDAQDPRDEEEPNPKPKLPGDESAKPKPTKPNTVRAPRVTLVLKGELAMAVNFIMEKEKHLDAKTTITESVLRCYRQLTTPTVSFTAAGAQKRTAKKPVKKRTKEPDAAKAA
jgi:hypothetical protein